MSRPVNIGNSDVEIPQSLKAIIIDSAPAVYLLMCQAQAQPNCAGVQCRHKSNSE